MLKTICDRCGDDIIKPSGRPAVFRGTYKIGRIGLDLSTTATLDGHEDVHLCEVCFTAVAVQLHNALRRLA